MVGCVVGWSDGRIDGCTVGCAVGCDLVGCCELVGFCELVGCSLVLTYSCDKANKKNKKTKGGNR